MQDFLIEFLFLLLVEYMVVGAFDFFVFLLLLLIFTLNHAPLILLFEIELKIFNHNIFD